MVLSGRFVTCRYVQPTSSRSHWTSSTRGHHSGWRLTSPISSQSRSTGAWTCACWRAESMAAAYARYAPPAMDFTPSDRVLQLRERIEDFLSEHYYPIEIEL